MTVLMKRVIAIIFLLVAFKTLSAQKATPLIDSLSHELELATSDTSRSLLLAELSFRYYTVPDSQYSIAKRGLQLATSIGFDKGIAANMYSLGVFYVNDPVIKLKYLNDALAIELKHNNKRQIGRIYLSLGVMLGENGEYKESLENLKKGLIFFNQLGHQDEIILMLNNIGYIFLKTENYDSSEFYLKKSLHIAKSYKSPVFMAIVFGSLAELFSAKNDLENSKLYLLESIKLNAETDLNVQADNYVQLAKIYQRLGNLKEAFIAAEKALLYAQKSKFLVRKKAALDIIGELYSSTKNYERAFYYLKQATRVNDSISLYEKNEQKERLLSRLERNEREARIKILERENEVKRTQMQLQEQEISEQKSYLIGSVILILLILFGLAFAWYAFKLRTKLSNELSYKSELKALRSQINPHFIFNSLNVIQDKMLSKQEETAIGYLGDFSLLLRRILANSNLAFISLAEEIKTVELYLKIESIRFDNSFKWIIDVDNNIDVEQINIPPMILQPLLESALLHGLLPKKGERLLRIRFTDVNNRLSIQIEDNGVGRQWAIHHKTGFAVNPISGVIQMINERIALLDKVYNLDSLLNIIDLNSKDPRLEGTRVEISFDLNKL